MDVKAKLYRARNTCVFVRGTSVLPAPGPSSKACGFHKEIAWGKKKKDCF